MKTSEPFHGQILWMATQYNMNPMWAEPMLWFSSILLGIIMCKLVSHIINRSLFFLKQNKALTSFCAFHVFWSRYTPSWKLQAHPIHSLISNFPNPRRLNGIIGLSHHPHIHSYNLFWYGWFFLPRSSWCTYTHTSLCSRMCYLLIVDI